MQIPGYTLIKKINSGGMATVYLATQHSVGRTVALKLMKPSLDKDPEFHQRFQREATIVGQLSHPNIIAIYDIGRHERFNYISMEFLPKGSLDEKITTGISKDSAVKIAQGIAAALEHAHSKGYVHRDIKPENILFRDETTPVLTDFGIARTIKSKADMTQVGAVIGTPYYMSPEQAKGEASDGRSDLYSLGVVLYEMLTGMRPFHADSSLALGIKHIHEQAPKLPLHLFSLQAIMDKLLAKKPEQRFQTAREFIDALTAVTHQKPSNRLIEELLIIAQKPAAYVNTLSAKLATASTKTPITPDSQLEKTLIALPEHQPTLAITQQPNSFRKIYWIYALSGLVALLLAGFIFTDSQPTASPREQWLSLNQESQTQHPAPSTSTRLDMHNLAPIPKIIEVQRGQFLMGSADKAKMVTLQNNFLIGRHEITFNEYDFFALETNRALPDDLGWGRGKRPVINISWDDAVAYANWLSKTTGKEYRLPTAAEWEYAARGNTTSNYWWGNNKEDARERANCRLGCKSFWDNYFDNKTQPVGSFPPNDFGLYDTAGNVSEWISDCADKTPSVACQKRAVRGGSFASNVDAIAVYSQVAISAHQSRRSIGFRLVQIIPAENTNNKVNTETQPRKRNVFREISDKIFRRGN